MNRYNKYLLEKRISRLERYFYESDVRNKVPSIFSKDIEEVKAAIKLGQNVNSIDNHGITVLESVCNNTKDDESLNIVKLLVKNGADLNPEYGRLIRDALYNRNYKIAEYLAKSGTHYEIEDIYTADNMMHTPVNTLINLLNKSFKDDIAILISEVQRRLDASKISVKDYTHLMNYILSFKDITYNNYRNVISDINIVNELKQGITSLADYLISELKVFPVPQIYNRFIYGMNDRMAKLLYSYIKITIKEHLHISLVDDFTRLARKVCEKLNKNFGSLGMNESFIRFLAKDNPVGVGKMAVSALSVEDIDLLKTIANCGNLHLENLCYANYGCKNDNLVKLFIKILRANKYRNYDDSNLKVIGEDNNVNKLFIEYLIEIELDQRMISICGNQLSPRVRKILIEFEVNPDKLAKGGKRGAERKYRKSKLISLIANDIDFNEAKSILKKFPELLSDIDVIDAINDPDNDHSFTARDLRKNIKEKEDSNAYDF